jgi:hypothetical protein
MSIQFIPPAYTQRPQGMSSKVGQALGQTLQGATNLYLQNKIQGYFDEQKTAQQMASRSKGAKALAALPQFKNTPGLEELLTSVPEQHWAPLLQQVEESNIGSMNLGGDISSLLRGQPATQLPSQPVQGSQQMAQQPPLQPLPTSATTAANLSAAQRASPAMAPYSPEFLAQMTQVPPAVAQMPGATSPEQELTQGQKPILLGDLPEEHYQALRNRLGSNTAKKEADKIRKSQIMTTAAQTKTETNRKREERESESHAVLMEKEPREYIKKLNDEYNSSLKKRPIYKTLESKAPELQKGSVLRKYLMDKYDLPAGFMLDKTGEVLEKLSQNLLRGISADYKGRILQSEVENYLKGVPSLANTPEGIVQLSKISLEMDKLSEMKWKLANEIKKDYRARGERLPEDLETQVLEKSEKFADDVYKNIENIIGSKQLQEVEDEPVIVTNLKTGRTGPMPRKFAEEAAKTGGYQIK